ncbi:MAG: glycosyltransferase family 2 protein [Salinivirgaceae bacterium]|jgi:cellulose synthase/poly-beta-1,6-N-acetylglucosamine synthase-like glycosyltransferase|nr:glycosyltransferase family 2 protein [Salinivirgaceae bacterium]
MIVFTFLFWTLVFIVFYSYFGYPILLFVISKFKTKKHNFDINSNYEPMVTLFVAAYNEQDNVDAKISNSLELDYPKDKLEMVWITDGSDDNTNVLLENYPVVKVYFEPERKGKINAMNRGMKFVKSEIVIFSDGNTLLSKEAVREIVNGFKNPKVGCIAGEKRIDLSGKEAAAASGEGFYWKYESWIKKLDAETGSCIGAAGELFAIRKELFFNVESDTILDDFIISLTIALQGYKIDYTPKAYAIEKASVSVAEEMKRKVRIAAGSIQTLVRLRALLNIFKNGFLSFQYFSHKVMRWVATPVSLVLLLPINIYLSIYSNLYANILYVHLLFYLIVAIGWLLKDKKTGIGIVFIPYYFFIANLSMWLGFFRYIKGAQSVNWERAKRSQ